MRPDGLETIHPRRLLDLWLDTSPCRRSLSFPVFTWSFCARNMLLFRSGSSYSNRYLRLVVTYWIVIVVTVLLIALMPAVLFPPAVFLAHFELGSVGEWVLLVFSNVMMFGQDLLSVLFSLSSNASLIPQAWSLALELWFYLLVPLLWRASDRTLWLIVIASLAIRLVIVSSSLPFWPWQQRFFPAEAMFFVLGMLSFRRSSEIVNIVRSGRACLVMVSALIVCAGWLYPLAFPWSARPELEMLWPSSILLGVIFYLTLPAMFSLTSRSRIDRLIGEFSYPIYLVHITVWYFVEPRILIVASIIASAPLVFLVEMPLERWRNNRTPCHGAEVRHPVSRHVIFQ